MLNKFFGEDVEVGDPLIDNALKISAVDPRMVIDLIRGVAPALVPALQAGPGMLNLRDDKVYYQKNQRIVALPLIQQLLNQLHPLAVALHGARWQMPKAQWELELQQALGPILPQLGGRWEDEGRRARVPSRAGELLVALNHQPREGFRTEVTLEFARELGLGLVLKRQGAMLFSTQEFGTWKMQDIVIGDPRFDDNFLIQGRAVEAIRYMLQAPAVKDALLRLLASAHDFSVDDHGVHVYHKGVLGDPQYLQGYITDIALVAETVLAHLSSAGQLGGPAAPAGYLPAGR
jgi:hypothetical protein